MNDKESKINIKTGIEMERKCPYADSCLGALCIWKDWNLGRIISFNCNYRNYERVELVPKFITGDISIDLSNVFCKADTTDDSKSDIRTFETGATRDTSKGKLDPEGFFSPLSLYSYMMYLHKHRLQSNGKYRDSDNWQKGIPLDTYAKSLWRHHFAFWAIHRGYIVYEERKSNGEVITHLFTKELEKEYPNWIKVTIEDASNGIIFNSMGYLHEYLKNKEKDCYGCGEDCGCKK